jgi:hypothetical protein
MFSSCLRLNLIFYWEKQVQVWTSRLNLDLCISALVGHIMESILPYLWEVEKMSCFVFFVIFKSKKHLYT